MTTTTPPPKIWRDCDTDDPLCQHCPHRGIDMGDILQASGEHEYYDAETPLTTGVQGI